jgi:hypothetical protein
MKNIIPTIAILFTQVIVSQTAFYNTGSLQMHEGALVGFHTNLINNGSFTSNKGLTGFYGTDEIVISGKNKIVFHDVEVAVDNGVYLETSLEITNSQNFIVGNISTPTNDSKVSLEFSGEAIFVGESNNTYVDGYASVSSDSDFTFPIGDDSRLRTMSIAKNTSDKKYTGAYFFENANNVSNFDSKTKEYAVGKVSEKEYWNLKGNGEVSVTLTWDEASNISNLTNSLNELRVIGWSKEKNKWVNLGNFEVSGDRNQGSLTSLLFTPNDYEVITFGTKYDGPIDSIDNGHELDSRIITTNVFDVSGNLVKAFKNDSQVNFTGMAKGIYMLDFHYSNGERVTKKILNN